MHLTAALNGKHRKLVLRVNLSCLAFENFDLRDDLVYVDFESLARLDRHVLALADKIDLNLTAVKELKSGPVVEFVLAKVDSLIGEVFNDPLVTSLLLHRNFWSGLLGTSRLCRGCLCFLGSRWLRSSSCCGCRCLVTTALSSEESLSTSGILLSAPVADKFFTLFNKLLMGCHKGEECLE